MQMMQAQQQQQRERLAHAQQAAFEWKERQQRSLQRAKRPTDTMLPEGIAEVVVGDGVAQYKRMREVERRLDAVVVRKMLELQEQDGRVPSVPRRRTMRVWVTNTAENQPWQGSGLDENAFDFDTGADSRYRVKIVGKLVDEQDPEDEGDEDEAGRAAEAVARPTRFSSFFSRVTVDLDRAKQLQPDNANLIDWQRPAPGTEGYDVDGLEFERKGDENLQCTISLHRDEPDVFKLAAPLADLLDLPEGTRDQAVNGLWEYVRAFELPVDESKNVVQCDDALKNVRLAPHPTVPTNSLRSSTTRRCCCRACTTLCSRCSSLCRPSSCRTRSAWTPASSRPPTTRPPRRRRYTRSR